MSSLFRFVVRAGLETGSPSRLECARPSEAAMRGRLSRGLFAVALLLIQAACDQNEPLEADSESVSTVESVESGGGAIHHARPNRGSAIDSIMVFDRAEDHRSAGRAEAARDAYLDLILWAADDPFKDGWGASALIPYALWRWAGLARQSADVRRDEVNQVLEAERALRDTKLSEGMFSIAVLDTLPQLQEELILDLAVLAERAGEHQRAQLLFLKYLEIARAPILAADAQTLRDTIIKSGWATGDHINLLRAKRLRDLRYFDQAEALLRRTLQSEIEEVVVEASLNLARLRLQTNADSLSPDMRSEVAELFERVIREARDPELIQAAYYERALLHRREGQAQSIDAFLADMQSLISEFPTGGLAPEAVYQLAQHYAGEYRRTGNPESFSTSQRYYEQLRKIPTPHGREDSMYYRPALSFYTRSLRTGDLVNLDSAVRLFNLLEEAKPEGPFHLPTMLWLARIAEQRGQTGQAEKLWRQLADEDPYGFYGIRARMHLQSGLAAASQLVPDGRFRDELAAAFSASKPRLDLTGASPYHERLAALVHTGRYTRALEAMRTFRRNSATTLRDTDLGALDKSGLLPEIVILLSARLDAIAARDLKPSPENRIEIAGVLGYRLGDWPASLISLSEGAFERQDVVATRKHSSYFTTAYPPVAIDQITEAARGFENVQPDLLYTVMRRESLFDPFAVSPVGALGYFQFMPRTFETLDRRWDLLQNAGLSEPTEFLFDRSKSIDLGARWFGAELLPRYGGPGRELLAVMDHNAGAPAVAAWLEEWRALGRENDIEFMIETARYGETRILARRVVRDLSIARSVGLLDRRNDAVARRMLEE